MKKYVMALDEGTTSTRTVLFDKEGKTVAIAQKEFSQIYPKSGYVEHDPIEIFSNQYSTMAEAVASNNINPDDIAAIGITNQRETTVVWEKSTGKPVYNAVVWQCRRTADICEELKEKGLEDYIRTTTGLKIDAYFSGTKIKWILDNVSGAREKAEKGELLFGTIDTWLVWKLTNGKVHITDYTNASRTMLFDIHKLCWDKRILKELNIPENMLPQAVSSSEIYGEIDFMGAKIPICGIAGDQQSALFGQGCFNEGEAKNTYGTGCFLLMNSGNKPIISNNGLISTVAANTKDEKVQYALEGSVFVGGAVIQWVRDELGFIRDASDSEYFASKVEDSGGVYVVPSFTGLGAPYWDMYARGIIVGLTRGSNRNHIIRASLESIAYQTDDLIKSVEKEIGKKITTLSVDGGAARNKLLMQFQSDISDIKVLRSKDVETTALGAAFLAGLAVGFWKDKAELKSLLQDGKIFTPQMSEEKRKGLICGWKKAIRCSREWGKEDV